MDGLNYLTSSALDDFISAALKEDVGDGDHSSLAAIPADRNSAAQLLIKASGIMAGIRLAEIIFHTVDPSLEIQSMLEDGQPMTEGQIGLKVKGNARAILTSERLVLNCMQRMCGIATYTNKLCAMIKGTGATILDTRKTTPNFRLLEKWAVVIGGGENHRYGLYDMIMLKDNHIDYAGGIKPAIEATNRYLQRNKLDLKIEIETRSLEEVQTVISTGGVDRIMLDNMAPSELSKAVVLINGKYETEASGGITENTIVEVANTGVDYISIGALTHSVKSLDLSLKAVDPQ